MTELISNLLDNAIIYGYKHGNILVKLTHKPIPFLTVEDDGPGIDDKERKKIFERFYRVPGSPGNGCGLGLAIAREIADLHQMNLILGHSTNGGTRFDLQFSKMSKGQVDDQIFTPHRA